MSHIDAGGDGTAGTVGDSSSASIGKDIQQVLINLGDKSPGEIANILRQLASKSDRLQIAVSGDAELGVPGVVASLNEIRNELRMLTERMAAMQAKQATLESKVDSLSREVDDLRNRVGDYGGSSHTNQVILYIVAALILLLTVVTLWQIVAT